MTGVVTLDMLREVADAYPPDPPRVAPRPTANGDGTHRHHGDGRPDNRVERCRAYLAKVGPAVRGEHGHNRTFQVARLIWNDFGLDEAYGWPLLVEFNAGCRPPWDEERGLRRKWDAAVKKGAGTEGRGFRLAERDDRPTAATHTGATAPRGEPQAAAQSKGTGWRFAPISSAELDSSDYRPAWLVEHVLVRGQPAIVGGPQKTLKTSLLIDLAISLATATPFLGKWPVPRPVRCVFLTGESGSGTVQETARRVAKAKGVELPAADRAGWQFDLPQLANLDHVKRLAEGVTRDGYEVVVIEPLYLSLLSGGDRPIDARNVYEMGAHLLTLATTFRDAGATPVLGHHANRAIPTGEPMELANLAYAGVAEFARQWLLLNRREPYRGDGEHRLWLTIGGSAGHGGLWSLDVSEGVVDAGFGGRRWDVGVDSPGAARAEVAAGREDAAREKKRKQLQADETAVLDALGAEHAAGKDGASVSRLRTLTALSHDRTTAAIERLYERGEVESVELRVASGKGATQTVAGYRRPPKA